MAMQYVRMGDPDEIRPVTHTSRWVLAFAIDIAGMKSNKKKEKLQNVLLMAIWKWVINTFMFRYYYHDLINQKSGGLSNSIIWFSICSYLRIEQ